MKTIILLSLLLLSACGGGGGGSPTPPAQQSAGYIDRDAGGEPYTMRCAGNADRIVLYLHTWSGDNQQVRAQYPDGIDGACMVSPNFNGPNTTAQALGSDDTIDRIHRALTDAKARTGLDTVHLIAFSGGTMAALNYMGRHPGVQKATLWLVIYDLETLFNTTQDQQLKDNMLTVIGHVPAMNDPDYLARSPESRLETVEPGPVIYMNAGTQDISTPIAQAEAARGHLQSRGVQVVYTAWPMGHVFGQQQSDEAVRQLQ